MTKRTWSGELVDCPPTKRFRLDKKTQPDILSSLSDEIILHILSFLSTPSLIICQRLAIFSDQENALWKFIGFLANLETLGYLVASVLLLLTRNYGNANIIRGGFYLELGFWEVQKTENRCHPPCTPLRSQTGWAMAI